MLVRNVHALQSVFYEVAGACLTCCRLLLLQCCDGPHSLNHCLGSCRLKPRCLHPHYTDVEAEKHKRDSQLLISAVELLCSTPS